MFLTSKEKGSVVINTLQVLSSFLKYSLSYGGWREILSLGRTRSKKAPSKHDDEKAIKWNIVSSYKEEICLKNRGI